MKRLILGVLGILYVVWGSGVVKAQMPDPRQMSGIPRPVTDLPDRSISVRVIRGSLSNNIPRQPVELHVGPNVQTVTTDEAGRAQFDNVPAGTSVKAVAIVDGERLESQEFPAPAQGGIRLLLVATDKTAGPPRESQPAVSGQVAIAGRSRFMIEPGEEVVEVYYLLDVVNTGKEPVNPQTPFVFDVPGGAVGTAVLEGSSSQATAQRNQVTVQGPFAPGSTLVQVAYELPAPSGSVTVSQRFPAQLEQLGLIIKKVGNTRVSSPQITRQAEMPADGDTYIAATGGAVPGGQPLVLTIDGMPHHSAIPRWTALSIAVVIVVIGVVVLSRPQDRTGLAAERKRLMARREKLFADLVRLEADHRNGRVDGARYTARREQLVASLEHLYGALDSDDINPGPASRAA